MPIKIVRKKSKCNGCPLDNGTKNKCFGMSDVDVPEMILLGEAPGAKEEQLGVPFVGQSGYLLKAAVDATGHQWFRSHKTNTILCRPPKNNYSSAEAIEAIERCEAGLWEELFALYNKGVKNIIAVGASAMKALHIDGSLTKVRGSIFMLKWKDGKLVPSEKDYDMLCVPTFHPAFLLRGQLKHEVTFCNDIEKAYNLLGKKYVPPKENFEMFPTIEWLEKKTKQLVKAKAPLAVDLETTGFVPGKAGIIVVGIATSKYDAFAIPFLSQGGKQYWKDREEKDRALACLKMLMKECPTLYQNGMFDCRHLCYYNTPAENIQDDIMILHHNVNPELPHNLGYITSIYGSTPFWKDEVAAKRLLDYDDETVRTYNLRDCTVIFQNLPGLIKDAKEHGTYKLYKDISMKLLPVVIKMVNYGMLVSPERLKKWRTALKAKERRLLKRMYDLSHAPEEFNFNSLDQMRFLMFDMEASQYKKAKEKCREIEENPKKKTNTKLYQANADIIKIFEQTKPFIQVKHALKKTESGSVSLDEEAMLNIQKAANNRLSQIKTLRRKKPGHVKEQAELKRLIDFITTNRKYAEVEKLLTTYTSFPLDSNNRLHSPYRLTGTTTGRFASGDKKNGEAGNVQNVPPEAKHIFVPPKGYEIAELDHSNLEMIIIGELSNDNALRAVFKKGLNVHDVNCQDMFHLTKDDALWESARKACKTYIFGRNYGGGLKGIYDRVCKAVPELGLTYNQFCAVDDRYRAKHPAYIKWRDQVERTVLKERCLENAFGRKRYFLGNDYEIVREGLNFPIQSSAADIINMSLIRANAAIESGGLNVNIIGSIHDSIVVEVPKKGRNKELKKLKLLMETPVRIGKRDVTFPVEVKSGPSWGETEKIEL